jgi:hypothetical protein
VHHAFDTHAAEGAVTGVAAGAGVGALWGLGILAGVLAAIGPAIAGGTLAAILSSAAAGAAMAGVGETACETGEQGGIGRPAAPELLLVRATRGYNERAQGRVNKGGP